MTREVRIERRGAPGLDAAERLYVTRDADGERLIPEPTGEALFETLTAPLTAAATSVQKIGEQVEADAAVTTEAVQQLLSVLAVWVPPGAVMNLGSPINLLLAGE